MSIVFEEIQANASGMHGDGGGDSNPIEPKSFDRDSVPILRQETNFEILDEIVGENKDLEEGGVWEEVIAREMLAAEIIFEFIEEVFVTEAFSAPEDDRFRIPIVDVGEDGVIVVAIIKEIRLEFGEAQNDEPVGAFAFGEDMNCFSDGDAGIPRGAFPVTFGDGFARFPHGRIEVGGDGEMSALFMPEVEDIGPEPCAVETKPEIETFRKRLPEGMAETEGVRLGRGVAFAKDGEGNSVVEFCDGGEEGIIAANFFDIGPERVFFVRRKDAAVGINGEPRKALFGDEASHERCVEVAESKDGKFCKFSEERAQRRIVRKLFDAEEFGQRGIRIECMDIIETGAAGEKHIGDAHDHFAWMKSAFTFFEGKGLVDAFQQFQLLRQSADQSEARKGGNGLFRFFDLKFDQVWKYHSHHLVFLFHPLGEVFWYLRQPDSIRFSREKNEVFF